MNDYECNLLDLSMVLARRRFLPMERFSSSTAMTGCFKRPFFAPENLANLTHFVNRNVEIMCIVDEKRRTRLRNVLNTAKGCAIS